MKLDSNKLNEIVSGMIARRGIVPTETKPKVKSHLLELLQGKAGIVTPPTSLMPKPTEPIVTKPEVARKRYPFLKV